MEMWKKVATAQSEYHDAKHTAMRFKVGDKVLLRSINIRTLRPKKKLEDRQLGPFVIEEKILLPDEMNLDKTKKKKGQLTNAQNEYGK